MIFFSVDLNLVSSFCFFFFIVFLYFFKIVLLIYTV